MTPALTGSLLPGITRDSLLKVAADLGIPAEEGTISVEQWRDGVASGEITEVFGCGTAAVVTPLGRVKTQGRRVHHRRRRARPGGLADPPGAAGHPDRQGSRPAPLDAQDRVVAGRAVPPALY